MRGVFGGIREIGRLGAVGEPELANDIIARANNRAIFRAEVARTRGAGDVKVSLERDGAGVLASQRE